MDISHSPAVAVDAHTRTPCRIPADIVEVYTLEDARKNILRTDTSGVILHRGHEPFESIAADLHTCEFRHWGRDRAERFVGSARDQFFEYVGNELRRFGVPAELSETIRLISEDMFRVNEFIRALTKEDNLRSYVGSMWRDDRGFHIDNLDNVAAFVAYTGPGCLVAGRDQVELDWSDPAQRQNPVRLHLKDGVQPYLTETFDIAFIKGRSDLTNLSLENNIGLPHSSPNPYDAVNGFDKRLTYLVYGTALGERFRVDR